MGIVQARVIDGRATRDGSSQGLDSTSVDVVERLLIGHRPTRRVDRDEQLTGFLLLGLEGLFSHFRPHPSKRPDLGYLFEETGPAAYQFVAQESDIIKIKPTLVA